MSGVALRAQLLRCADALLPSVPDRHIADSPICDNHKAIVSTVYSEDNSKVRALCATNFQQNTSRARINTYRGKHGALTRSVRTLFTARVGTQFQRPSHLFPAHSARFLIARIQSSSHVLQRSVTEDRKFAESLLVLCP